MSDLWKRTADFFKEWDGEDMTKSMPLYVDELREINSNRIELIRLERERKEIRDKAIDEFCDFIHGKAKENNGLRLSSEIRSWTHASIYYYLNEFKEKQMKEVGE